VLCGPLLTGALVQLTGGWHLVPYALGTLGVAAAAGALALHVGLRRLQRP
jgi:cyanate permease